MRGDVVVVFIMTGLIITGMDKRPVVVEAREMWQSERV